MTETAGFSSMQALDAPVVDLLTLHYGDLYNVIFTDLPPSQPSTSPSGWAFFALTIPYAIIAYVILQKICLRVGTFIGRTAGYPSNRSHNIGDSFREFVGMSLQSVTAFMLLRSEPWAWDPLQWGYAVTEGSAFVNATLVDQGVRPSFSAYYPFEFGWYMGLFICMLIEYPQKSDFYVMAAHHWVTMFLVGFSAIVGHTRIGILVMLLHDSSDTFLHGSKILHYLFEGSAAHILCDVTFATFALIFFVTRLVLYPFLLYQTYSAMYEVAESVTFMEKVLLTALAVLVPFHMYWFALIMKILKEALMGGEVQGDVRDVDEVDYERRKDLGVVASKED